MTTDKPNHKKPKDEMGGQTSNTNLDNDRTTYPENDDHHHDDEPMMDRLI